MSSRPGSFRSEATFAYVIPPMRKSCSRSSSSCASPVVAGAVSGNTCPMKSNISVLAEQVYLTYGRPSPAAMAWAPMVLPVPAGPRRRKLRMGMAFSLVLTACWQMLTTSFGMTYHAGSFGTSSFSRALRLRLGLMGYFPTKSQCSIRTVGLYTGAGPVCAMMENSPHTTVCGMYLPASSCTFGIRVRLPVLSIFSLIWAGQVSSLIRR